MTDLFAITGRHWRVSSGTVTAAIVTVTVVTVTVTVSSCLSCLPLGKSGSNHCHSRRLWEQWNYSRNGFWEVLQH